MISLRPTWQRVKTHFSMTFKISIGICAAVIMVLAVVYKATEYVVPADKRLDIYVIGYTSTAGCEQLERDLLAALPDDQEEVNVYGIMEFGSTAREMVDLLTAYLVAGEGNLYIFSYDAYGTLLRNYMTPLDDHIADGTLVCAPGVDPYTYYYGGTTHEGEYELPHATYLIPLEDLWGVQEFTDLKSDSTDQSLHLVAGIPLGRENEENAIRALEWIMKNKTVYTDVEGIEDVFDR